MKERYKHIKVPSEVKYISDLPKNILDEIYDNKRVLIDKFYTGCGWTTHEIECIENVIVAVPFKGLIKNKLEQKHTYPLFEFSSDVENRKEKLKEYIEFNKIKKILVTYDSVPLLMEHLTEFESTNKDKPYNDYRLVIDECHKILDFAGSFKPIVIDKLLNEVKKFNSVIAVTATPTREDFIPEAFFDGFKLIRLDWDKQVPVIIKHKNVAQKNMRATLQAIVYNHLSGVTEGNAYIFVNSVSLAAEMTKTFISTLKYEDNKFNIICADTESNFKKLKRAGLKRIGKSEFDNFYKINFVTATAFEGQDFMDPEGVTYVISDGSLDHTKIDISTQLPQIAGRLRRSKYKHIVNFVWSYSQTNGIDNFEDYARFITEEQEQYNLAVIDFDNARSRKTQIKMLYQAHKDIWLLAMEGEKPEGFILNPFAADNQLNVFVGTQLQYYTIWKNTVADYDYENVLKETEQYINYSLCDILAGKVENNLEIKRLPDIVSKKLGRCGNFVKAFDDFALALSALYARPGEIETLLPIVDEILDNPAYFTIKEFYETFGAEEVFDLIDASDSMKKEVALRAAIDRENGMDLIRDAFKKEFAKVEFIPISEFKSIVESIKEKYDISSDIKATTNLLKELFDAKQSTRKINGEKTAVYVLTNNAPDDTDC